MWSGWHSFILTLDLPYYPNINHNFCHKETNGNNPGLGGIKQQLFYPFKKTQKVQISSSDLSSLFQNRHLLAFSGVGKSPGFSASRFRTLWLARVFPITRRLKQQHGGIKAVSFASGCCIICWYFRDSEFSTATNLFIFRYVWFIVFSSLLFCSDGEFTEILRGTKFTPYLNYAVDLS